MLRQIHLDALKCFDRLSLPLAGLTLLTGFNAAGKSTSLQALLLLTQALRSGGRSSKISLNGPLVQLGTVGEILNETAGRRAIRIGVETDAAKLIWNLGTEERTDTRALIICGIDLADAKGERSIAPVRPPLDLLLPSDARSPAIDNLVRRVQTAVFISAVRDGASEFFPSPMEPEPVHADVGLRGEYAAWWFAQRQDDDVPAERRHRDDPGTTLRRQVCAWASYLFPGAEANAITLHRTSLVQLQMRTRVTEDWRRPANTGYGLTYALPILVAALLAKEGQILVIDSPEAHLHPRGQAHMGRFLGTIAAAGVQILIETHSDHVLNGVRLVVREGILPSELALIHFFAGATDPLSAQTPGQPPVTTAHIDPAGGISPWPDGFFDQAEKDLATLAGFA